jgi:AcrR family transcriptional regulator
MLALSTLEDELMSAYHHGNLRSALVQAAVELAGARGPEGVVLREVARRTGVSHNAAYRHFADREELLAEVARVGMTRLAEAMAAELSTVDVGPPPERAVARLRATGRAYVNFALAQPGLFDVAFAAHTGTPTAPDSDSPAPRDPYALLGNALDDLVRAGSLSPDRRVGAEALCWSAVHGFAVLHLRGPLQDVTETDRNASLELLLDHIQRGLL